MTNFQVTPVDTFIREAQLILNQSRSVQSYKLINSGGESIRIFKILLWVLLILALSTVTSCMTHPWFKSRFPWETPPDPNQQPEIVNAQGQVVYHADTPDWVLLVDDCLRAGGNRTTCIDDLPPEELANFQEWQRQNVARRRLLLRYDKNRSIQPPE